MREQRVGEEHLGHNGLVGAPHPGAKRRDLRDGPRYPARLEFQAGYFATEKRADGARIRRGWNPAQKFSVSEQSAHNRREQAVEPKPGWIVKGPHVAVSLALELRVRDAHQQFHIADGFERHPYRAKVLIQAETKKYGMLVGRAVGNRRKFQVVRQQGGHLGAVQIIHNDGCPYVAVVVPDAVRIVWFTRLALWRELGRGSRA